RRPARALPGRAADGAARPPRRLPARLDPVRPALAPDHRARPDGLEPAARPARRDQLHVLAVGPRPSPLHRPATTLAHPLAPGAFPYIARFMAVPALDATNRIGAIAVGGPLALLAGVAAARTGAWLGTLEVARQDGPAAPIAGVDVGRDRAVEAGGWAGD